MPIINIAGISTKCLVLLCSQMMKMKRIFPLLLACLVLPALVWAQNATIQGKITDEAGKPIANAAVVLQKTKDSTVIKTSLTNAEGEFDFTLATTATNLWVRVEAIGFATYLQPLAANGKLTIKLQPAEKMLANVTVTARKPMIEVKADKTIFNVEQSINATGSNAMELLQKSPGVLVDNNDNISMKGKTGVRVYIDGRMTQLDARNLAQYLRSINSNDIESIEMISNPSAKYDAAGNAGIINIKMKKNKKVGTNGSVNAGFVQGVTPKGNGSVNLNYRNKKVNLFSNTSYNIGQNQNELQLNRLQRDTLYDQRSVNRNHNSSTNVKAGMDYFIDSKQTIGVILNGNFSNRFNYSSSSTPISSGAGNKFESILLAETRGKGSSTNANANINYRYADTSGREVNVDADYGIFRSVNNTYQPNFYVDANGTVVNKVINRIYTPTDIDIATLKVDAERPFAKGKFGYGAKFSYVKTKNAFNFYNDNAAGNPILSLGRSNDFTYTENVNAAYVNYNRQVNAKLSVQGGLRAEQTNSKGVLARADGAIQTDNEVVRSYINLFPSAAISYMVNAKNALNLTYSRRIDRPTYQDLNPFENKIDELTYEKGNAFLRPQYTHVIEATHTFKGMLNTSLAYSDVKDFATQVTDTIRNATFVQQRNLASQKIVSLTVSSPLPITKWWNGFANLWVNRQFFSGFIGENKVSTSITSYGAYMQHGFTLGKDYTAELSGWFNGPSVWGGTWRTRSQGAIDIGIQKQIMKKKGNVKLSVTDLFFTAPWKATNDFGGTKIQGSGNWESRTIRLSFSYRFGSNQIKGARQRKTGLEAESSRIKG
ncbi:MAG: TonB-dependent receptor [Bacteroidetes bacterium]|nr:MAG: TonB-dependent receptor [Bacteroidota bacterium]TAF93723.1 MAG: TonB-dependent receptor [Bacteroidota bacterium]